jgi:hypothetical protein
LLPIIREAVPLAPLTTFQLGGPARFFAEIVEVAELGPALTWARDKRLPVFVLGGGSSLVVGDDGFAGLVLRMNTRGRPISRRGVLGRDEQGVREKGRRKRKGTEPGSELVPIRPPLLPSSL